MADYLERARRLIALAVDPATTEEERRSVALKAVMLIHQRDLRLVEAAAPLEDRSSRARTEPTPAAEARPRSQPRSPRWRPEPAPAPPAPPWAAYDGAYPGGSRMPDEDDYEQHVGSPPARAPAPAPVASPWAPYEDLAWGGAQHQPERSHRPAAPWRSPATRSRRAFRFTVSVLIRDLRDNPLHVSVPQRCPATHASHGRCVATHTGGAAVHISLFGQSWTAPVSSFAWGGQWEASLPILEVVTMYHDAHGKQQNVYADLCVTEEWARAARVPTDFGELRDR